MATYEVGFKPSALGTGSLAPQGLTFTPNKLDYTANGSTIPAAHLVQAGQYISGFYVAGRAATSGTNAQARMGAYVTNSTATSEGALVTGDNLPPVTASTTVQWHFVAVNISLAAFVGQWIKPAKGSDGGQFRPCNVAGGVSGDFNSASTSFPNPFGSATNQSSLIPMYMVIEDGAGITSVNDGAGITAGSTGNTAQLSGFAGAPTSGSFGGKAVTVTGGTSSQAIFSFPDYADGETYPDPGGNHTLSLTLNSTTAQIANVPLNRPTGMAIVTLASLITDDSKYIGFHVPGIADGMKIVFPREVGAGSGGADGFEVRSDSGVRASSAGTRVCWLWNNTTGVMTQLNVSVTAAGEVSVTLRRGALAKPISQFLTKFLNQGVI